MGIAALDITEGISSIAILKLNMKVFLVSTLASLAMAMPGEINNVNRVSGFLNPSWAGAWPDSAVDVAYPGYTASWPGATVSITRGKRSAPAVVDNVNRVSGSSPFPIYTAAWPGATVSVTHGKKKRSAPVVALVDNVNQVSGSSPFPIYTAAWPGATVSVNHGK